MGEARPKIGSLATVVRWEIVAIKLTARSRHSRGRRGPGSEIGWVKILQSSARNSNGGCTNKRRQTNTGLERGEVR
jgi:hypothetical protein